MSQVTFIQSTWTSKLKAMGPGILMASAAVGGSHIVSSTQAGGSYGWSLLLLVILANVLNIHFSVLVQNILPILVKPWSKATPKRKFYLWIFFILNVFLLWSTQPGSPILAQPSSLALFQ